ncbi:MULTISPECIES: hypothetical protein [Rhizobium]|uniref:Uncharacterized protein n=1 Tax=Rhizobium johnstonii (strain DSM 114642 / LMG 32736 / 3841) TaxID=216596 RepID=Q1MHY6_RHIJ3|nr:MULTISPECIES: hypothetical protein [Rhizobium]MBB5261214.1 hypothetical protein [Rhizobium leguminosarum]MBY5378056.1 hypothetical protein [Rhizobium leguminosarum]MDX6000406.1 hypothetical protein [Rhizobium leguminosarum]NEJ81708.1 hypothetical protein [Rhizobium leguminosarum]OOO46057.1 hypothetical protein BS629_20920 [Rhizobium leguminosarum bv. viciae USDA 2370]
MTGAKESSWKLVVKGLKSKVLAGRKELIAQVLKDVGGDAAPIRQARRALLTMSVDALSGTPRFIDVYGEGEICLISFDDLLDILADPPPTLAEVMGRVTR